MNKLNAIAFANHAPEELAALIKAPVVYATDEPVDGEHVIVFGVGNFMKFHKNPDQFYYVIDNPISVMSLNIPKADIRVEESIHIDGITLVKLNKLPAFVPVVPEFRNFNIVDASTVCAKSQITFLNQFMTFIYSMPSETHQTPVKKLVCKWMATTESFGVLQRKLEVLRQTVKMTDKQVKRLYDILDSDTTVKYRHALQQKGEEDDVAKELRVSAYELRYIRAINRSK